MADPSPFTDDELAALFVETGGHHSWRAQTATMQATRAERFRSAGSNR